MTGRHTAGAAARRRASTARVDTDVVAGDLVDSTVAYLPGTPGPPARSVPPTGPRTPTGPHPPTGPRTSFGTRTPTGARAPTGFERPSGTARRLGPWLSVLALCGGVEVLVRVAPLATGIFVHTALLAVGAAVAGWGFLGQARRAAGRMQLGMGVAAASAWLWGLTNVVWLVAIPTGSTESAGMLLIMQVISLLAVGSTPIGLLLCFPGSGGTSIRLRRAIDVAMIFGALFIIAWRGVFQFIHQACQPTVCRTNLTMMSIELIFAAISLVLLSRSASRGENAVNVLAASMVLYAFATVGLTANNSLGRPWFLDGVASAFLIATYATARASRLPLPDPSSLLAEQTAGRWMALPYLPVLAAFAVVGAQQAQEGTLGTVLPWVLLGTAGIMLVRQFLYVRANQALLVEVSRQRTELAEQALSDPLTGLGNRIMFTYRAEQLLASAGADTLIGLIIVDLDGFKRINDTWGHAAGDELLRGAATRMAGCVRAGDTVVRFGGDEFVVLLSHLDCADDAVAMAQRILSALAAPMPLTATTVQVGASAGVTVARGAEHPIDDLLSEADVALYDAKRRGKSRVCRFDPGSRPVRGAAPLTA